MKKEEIEKKLAGLYGPSSCPEKEAPVEKKSADAVQVEEKQVQESGLAGMVIADDGLAAEIDALIAMERNYPLGAYMSEDYLRAGVYVEPGFRATPGSEEITRKFSRIFFGKNHHLICKLFEKELVAAGKRHIPVKYMGKI
jgi:hypothetical protein